MTGRLILSAVHLLSGKKKGKGRLEKCLTWSEEGGFVASYPELRGCLTSGETAEAALKNALDCKREWLAAALEDGYEIPDPTSDDEYSGQFKLRLPKSLHRALAENSKREGISMNQYCLYLLTKNNAEFRHGA